jgi:hypothetical protein
MKYATIASLFAAQATAYSNELNDGKKYVKIVEGFLYGTIQAEGFTDIEQCIQDGEAIFRDAESAYEHFAKKDVTDAIDGVKDIAAAIQKIQAALKDCSSVKGDWEKMEKIAKEFKSPKSFAWHIAGDIWHNRVEITKEVHTAIDDWESQKWYDFGLQCGEAAEHVFIGKETQLSLQRQKDAAIQAGFLNAFGGKFNLENLLFCIYEEDQAALMLDVAYQALQKVLTDKTWQDALGDAIGVVIGTVGAYQQFEQGLPVCEAVVSSADFELSNVTNAMTVVSNPVENLARMTENIKQYEGNFQDEAASALFHYHNEDYEKFGEFLGNMVKFAAYGPDKKEDLFLY